ncbi:MAG: preprotein translocase subunit SecE [Phycisphaerae bacterium]|nr:preprotein translocase subunit SecE [Phycisphaerae bacterium]
MAKGKKKGKKRKDGLTENGEIPDTSPTSSDALESDADGDDYEVDDSRSEPAPSPARRLGAGRVPRGARVGGLSIYKPGQGYYTRVGTAIGAGVLIAGMWNYLYGVLGVYVDAEKAWTFYVQLGVPTLVGALIGVVVYWLVGRKASTCDFMILTEGEMKKVSWSSRKEVIGSTKVVVFVVIAMSIYLFVADYLFSLFFHWIGVLHIARQAFGKAAGN